MPLLDHFHPPLSAERHSEGHRAEAPVHVGGRVEDGAIDWFVLREGRSETLAPGPDGRYRSDVPPGLWLAPAALIRGDPMAVLEAVRQGLAAPEPDVVVARSREAAARREG